MIAPSEEPKDRHPDALASSAASASAPAASAASTIPADVDLADDPQVEGNAAERVIFFSDAVVAIAITLLALALPVPGGFDGMTNRQLLRVLGTTGTSTSPS